eukprot:767612-Hanusia_phi.AAC.1
MKEVVSESRKQEEQENKAVAGGHKFENNDIEWGMDMGSEHERYISEKVFKKPVCCYNYPKAIKVKFCFASSLASASLLHTPPPSHPSPPPPPPLGFAPRSPTSPSLSHSPLLPSTSSSFSASPPLSQSACRHST